MKLSLVFTCVNALKRASAISIVLTVSENVWRIVSMPLNGLPPFLFQYVDDRDLLLECVNALKRASAISILNR